MLCYCFPRLPPTSAPHCPHPNPQTLPHPHPLSLLHSITPTPPNPTLALPPPPPPKSLEEPVVRSNVLRLAYLPLWAALQPGRLALELRPYPQLKRHWQHLKVIFVRLLLSQGNVRVFFCRYTCYLEVIFALCYLKVSLGCYLKV